MKPQKLFNQVDQELVKQAIEQAERKISGEIVPVVARSSGSYQVVPFALSLLGILVASMVVWFLRERYPYAMEAPNLWIYQAIGFFFGGLLGELPWVVRRLSPRALIDRNVRRAAMAEFMETGVHHTHHRTGILIYISVFERKVYLLADGGVHSKLGTKFWDKSVAKIVEGIRAGHPGKALAHLITELGDELKAHFPHRPEDQNEIADGIRFRN